MISVIVPAHNAQTTITACVAALMRQENTPTDYEVIVVDDGSTDDTARLAAQAGARVIQQEKRGPAAARNSGIRAACGEITCFTDADCAPLPDWIRQITAPLLADPDIAGVKGAYTTGQREITARFVQTEYEDKYDRLRQYPRITFMDFYSAAYRRAILLAHDGFDERFSLANSEDRELSYRLAALGYQMIFQPHAIVSHHHARSVTAFFRKKVLNGFWTAQAVRHFPERTIEDTYTPQVEKVQIGLMGLLAASLGLGLFLPFLFFISLFLTIIFLLTTVPFVQKAWPKDKIVAAAAPFYLALRGFALGLGYVWGLARPVT